MNTLVACWHRADVDVAEHLTLARGHLVDQPGLETALAMVDAALAEVEAWTDASPDGSRVTLLA